MNFSCNKEELTKAVSIATRAVSRLFDEKNITACILFEAKDNILTLKATDISLSIKAQIPVLVSEAGSCAVPAKSLYDIISKFPDSDIDFKLSGKNKIDLKCQNSKVQLNVVKEDDFPDFYEPDDTKQVKLPQKDLRDMIDTTIFAAATASDDKPILTGLYFDAEPGYLTLVGVDGYRMAVKKCEAICDGEVSCIVPARALREISRSLNDSEENVKIVIDEAMATFERPGLKIYSRLIEGEYLNYKKLIPTEFLTSTSIKTEALREAIERAQVLARDGNNVVALKIDESQMNITSKSELGSIDEDIDVVTRGEGIRIGFNTKYLLDVLKNIPEVDSELKFNTPITPCVIKKDGHMSYTYLVLPVQLRD